MQDLVENFKREELNRFIKSKDAEPEEETPLEGDSIEQVDSIDSQCESRF